MRQSTFAWTAALCLMGLLTTSLHAAEGPPVRDQWYLDAHAAPSLAFAPVVRLAGISANTRDQWYLGIELVASRAAEPGGDVVGVSTATRDRWYLEP